MISCGTRQADLKAYLDGELRLHERAAMWLHLLHCSKCREAKTAMTEISRRVGEMDGDALPAALRTRILSSVTYTDTSAAGPAPEPVRKHRVRPPLILVGGATAAALFAAILMRPVLFPSTVANKDAAAISNYKRSSSRAAAPATPTAVQEQQVRSTHKAPAALSTPGVASPSPGSPKTQDFDETSAGPPAMNAAAGAAASPVAKPMSESAGQPEKSLSGPAQVDGARAAAKPQAAAQSATGRRESDYMNVYPGDEAKSAQQADSGVPSGPAHMPLKSNVKNEPSKQAADKQKSREKAQAQRNARRERSSASKSRDAGTSK